MHFKPSQIYHGTNNYSDRPQFSIIDTVVIHYTAASFLSSYNTLTSGAKVSAHYLIDANGEIHRLVPDFKKAWHAGESYWNGRSNLNNTSIGIELVNNGSDAFPDSQIQSLCRLISHLKIAHPAITDHNIVGHSDITASSGRKIDPGAKFPWDTLHQEGHGIYYELSDFDTDANYKLFSNRDRGDKIEALQIKLSILGYDITPDGIYGKETANVVKAFHLHYNQNPEFGWTTWDSISDAKLNSLLESIQYQDYLSMYA